MSAPRLEIRLDQIGHNARTLVHRLGGRGVTVTGVTKATLGSPEIALELLRAGVTSIGESRIENIEALRDAGLSPTMTLIRSPMLSQVDRVVAGVDISLNTELDVIAGLSAAARDRRRSHGVVLMVELGDLREGILPADLEAVVRRTLTFPNIVLRGVGANLACQHGVAPDDRNMGELSRLVDSLEAAFGVELPIVSGGNSANLDWALDTTDLGRVNNLRLGEAVLLGCEPLRRRPLEGLFTGAITLVAEVIESKSKPMEPWGERHQSAFGLAPDDGHGGAAGRSAGRAIVALGRQDVDPGGLRAPEGVSILGASSDHLVLDSGAAPLAVGSEVRFGLDYGALLAAMTSPFVGRRFLGPT